MIQYEWKIEGLDRKTADGFVTTAYWTVMATDGDYSASSYGSCGFDGELITPYEDLTKEQVLEWVLQKVNKEETEASLAARIEALKSPVTTSGIPWQEKSF